MAKQSVSVYDIAQLAGVSTATVSNVLNRKGSYSQKAKELVERIAREQGYVANFAAKSLREASTKTVAIVTPDVSNDFFSTLVLKAESLLHEAATPPTSATRQTTTSVSMSMCMACSPSRSTVSST